MARARRKLIIVSNRGPVSFTRGAAGERSARRGGGGLATALRSLLGRHDVTWIASAMTAEDRAVAEEAAGEAVDERGLDGSAFRLRLVAHEPDAYDGYYNVVANPTLWFVQHYLWHLAQTPSLDRGFHRAWGDGYVRVNETFAAAAVAELSEQPEAAVFFHDYHLYLAPRLVRLRRPDALLAHFVHIPWPQPDYWRVLPDEARRAIHDGLLANDIVSFHTNRWRRSFASACEQLLDAECDANGRTIRHHGHETLVTHQPISVDPAEFEGLAERADVLEEEREILASHPHRIVLRVDRTDPSKNVVRGFQAFELYLERHPHAHGGVTMLALLDPSRQDIPEYSEYLGAIQRAVRAVNDRFSRDGWSPIDLRVRDNFAQTLAAYRQFDVLLVNAIFDGLNLVSKEAPLVNRRDGVVILSENAGAHEELGEWALTVNPFDLDGQAEAIHRALEMAPEERRRRAEAIRQHVREHDQEHWIEGLLRDLDRKAAPVGS